MRAAEQTSVIERHDVKANVSGSPHLVRCMPSSKWAERLSGHDKTEKGQIGIIIITIFLN